MLLQSPCVSSMRSSQHHCYLSHALRHHHRSSLSPPDLTRHHHDMVIPSGVGGVGRGQLPILFDFCISLPSVQAVGRWRVFFYNFSSFFPFSFLFSSFFIFYILYFPFSFFFFLFSFFLFSFFLFLFFLFLFFLFVCAARTQKN